ncbi:alpha-ketoacid dehydrogenase subunit alpha/beta [Chlamydiifrater phoenicopteri]|uniref:alpha-ketoacid dehydrogenase subunit alpha/beta n=1 Tax=Chlamydiifrater phoenicopteri TaxID=2681469 RepID=UPI001FEB54C1|nr:thiamine pyrophosphate-dependent enzyme [Chlamydiifrater phoenicopteri]
MRSSLIEAIEILYRVRLAEEKMFKLSRQSDSGGTFQLSCAGHELVGILAAKHLRAGKDWFFPYYRDQALPLALGCSLKEIFGSFLARDIPNHSSGRMMPYHYSHKKFRICCQSSIVGSQFLHAAGRGWAVKNSNTSEVVYVSGGEGATSQGEFHEMLNFVSLHHLPVVTVIQNNQWAISVPFEKQCGANLASLGRCYNDLSVYEVSGTSYRDLDIVFSQAVRDARLHSRPALIIAEVARLQAHSNSDNHEKYRTAQELSILQESRDPLSILEDEVLLKGEASREDLLKIQSSVKQEVEEAASEALLMPFPGRGTAALHVYAPPVDALIDYEVDFPESEPKTMRDAIREAIVEEMQRDAGVIVFGEDVAGDKGGVFGVTRGLTDAFGENRCFNTPLAEATIIGTAIGMAFDEIHKPIAEIQFADYIWPGINQLFGEASSIHYRSAGEWECPIVIRTPCGGYIQGGPYHSQSIEGFLAHCPGIKVAYPSNAADAKALMKAAIRDRNPVVFMEHKALYQRRIFSSRAVYSSNYVLPFGKAATIQEGEDLTVVSWGMPLVLCADLLSELQSLGISVTLIDLRTLVPWDSATVIESVKKTGKLLVVHEAPEVCGFGSEIVAVVAEEAGMYLDAPIRRLCGLNTPVPYCKTLENEVLPQKDRILSGIKDLAEF